MIAGDSGIGRDFMEFKRDLRDLTSKWGYHGDISWDITRSKDWFEGKS